MIELNKLHTYIYIYAYSYVQQIHVHATVVQDTGTEQLQTNPAVAAPCLSTGKSTRRAVTKMGSNRIASGITGKRAGEARSPLAGHLGEGKLSFQTPLSCGSIHL